MKTYVYPADETACGYYRLIWPAQAMQAQGFDVEIVTKKDVSRQFQGQVRDGKMINVIIPTDADVVVLQRPTHDLLQQAVPLIRGKGVAVVIDMDDDLTCIDPRNPAWTLMHPLSSSEHSWRHALPACEQATLVTVSTPELLDVYARKTEGRVLPNYVPRYFTEVVHEDSAVVGWGGSVHSHPDDLQSMGPAISRLVRDLGSFSVVGPELGIDVALGKSVAASVQATGPVNFLEWPHHLAQHLGIGVAPTANTRFNRAKSWLKPLEYASVGVVPISSDRPAYVDLAKRHGVGTIASSPKDWYRQVMRFARDDDLRRETAALVRSYVQDNLTIEKKLDQWTETWQLALDIQRNGSSRTA